MRAILRHGLAAVLAVSIFGLRPDVDAGSVTTAQARAEMAPAPLQYAPKETAIHWTGWQVVKGKREEWKDLVTVFQAPDGIIAQLLKPDGKTIRAIKFCTYCTHAQAKIDAAEVAAIWPLSVGKAITFTRVRADTGKSWTHTVTVQRTETIDTGFGPVDTYVVQEDITADQSDWRGSFTWWWAPSVGYVVKRAGHDTGGFVVEEVATRVEAP